ncbi:hypothetical protein [Amycolatopsis saalfeldensis]|uniref:Vegetative cell wall protein gp1 n=1 Tax=Amycolatopsis saalfeldensis TaxID=394193 RepID=A0A1H8VYI4_9PSEU|nr:hypothetical protein [Amycolatopsis saalfeldensis]SEP20307.1 hypothetical protein SAMN04489732_104386 [Amycolatopsis saalfeldensis]
MRTFFEELAKKLADRWVGLLLLPGALFALTAWLAARLGQAHALDWTRAPAAATLASIGRLSGGAQAILVLVALLAVTGAGLAVQALAALTRALWLGRWPRLFARPQVRRRRRRWERLVARRRELEAAYPGDTRTPDQQERIDDAAARITRFALARPGRPTWLGDRLHAVERVALDRSGLDLAFGWSRLWLVLPDPARAEITAASSALTSAIAVGTWGWPYLMLGAVWWPSAVLGAVVLLAGWARARPAADDLAALSEAAVDLHGRTLAVALGVAGAESRGPLTPGEGERVSRLLRKGR